MSPLTPTEQSRMLDLLADRALGDLAPADSGELEALVARAQGQSGFEDLVAALVLAADDRGLGDMPAPLRFALQARGERLAAGSSAGRIGPDKVPGGMPGRASERGSSGWLGWTVAAAALVLAAVGWWRPTPMPVPLAPPAERLAALEAEPDTVVIDLSGQGELASVGKGGEIVWNPRLQEGFLRLSALPGNDPDNAQYQLWIFDETRGAYAVDAGVFNVSRPATGEVIVPFEPKLGVGRAKAFAVTREQPGGVVVTDQSGLVLLAPVPDEGG